ncbi:hypothetical protein QTP88_016818 [Uroleucon formosanum]
MHLRCQKIYLTRFNKKNPTWAVFVPVPEHTTAKSYSSTIKNSCTKFSMYKAVKRQQQAA